jgi:uncharacterized repeat protein (TIGR01451 family)
MNRPGQRTRLRRSTTARLEALESRQLLTTFTVANTNDLGAGSLRAAILASNQAGGSNTIDFSIPGSGVQTIALASALPALINPTVVDATTQPGYAGTPLVELEGAGVLDTSSNPIPGVNGLVLSGGTSVVEGLAINRFTGNGIYAARDGNTITANVIGLDAQGTQALGNGGSGIVLAGRNNTVSQNLISANTGAGLFLGGSSTGLPTNNLIESNKIGTDVTGSADRGNGQAGVDIESANNTIGAPGQPNIIAFNGGPGVLIGNAPYLSNIINNRVENDSIFKNVGLGIDLGGDGVTANAPGYQYGPNRRQPFPDITSAYPTTGGTQVEGNLVALPNAVYTIDFYANDQPGGGGYGQGQTPIGEKTVHTDGAGFADLTTILTGAVTANQYITATATDATGDTSEFGLAQLVTPTAQADLSVVPNNTNPTVQAGASASYSFQVVNDGPSAATDVVFTDTLPLGAIFVSGSTDQGVPVSQAGGVVTAAIGKLASGDSTTVTLTFILPSTGTATNLVSVSATQDDPLASDNTAVQNILVQPAAPVDLSLYGNASPYPVQVGQPLTFNFVVTNFSFNQATGVVFNDPLPAGLAFDSVTTSQGSASHVGNDVTVNLGNLAGGTNALITIVARPTTPGPINNFATVKGNELDPNAINNATTVFSYVTPAPATDVAVLVTAAPQPAAVGQPFSYAILVGDPGTASASGVVLTDVLTDAASIVSIKPSQGSYTLVGNILTVNFGNLAIGAQAEVLINLIPGAPGSIVNRASIVSNEPDFNIYNNFSQLATAVVGQALPPAVIDQKLALTGKLITSATLTFNEALDTASAENLANYAVLDLGSNGSLSAKGPKVAINSAVYDPVTRSVTLTFKKGLSIGRFYKIVVNGPGAPGLVDTSGNVLDGERNGLQNGIYQSLVGRGTTTRPIALQIGVTRPKPVHPPKPPAKHHH